MADEAVTLLREILDDDGLVVVPVDEVGAALAASGLRVQDGIVQAEVLFPFGVGDPLDLGDDEDDDVQRWVPVADLAFDRGVAGLLALALVGKSVTAVENPDQLATEYRIRLVLSDGMLVTLLASRTDGKLRPTIEETP